MRGRYELVVFDWDGTVVDSTTMIALSIQRAAADLGLAVPSFDRASHVIGLGLVDALACAVPDLVPARAQEFAARYRHHYLAGESAIVLFDGMRELLGELAAADMKLAVATGKSRRGLDRAFDTTGLGPLFHASRCADETQPKPHPAMLLELASELAVLPERMLMVGDTTHDLEMAHAAGVDGLGVTYGAHRHAQLAERASRALLSNPQELRTWLQANR